MSNPFLSIIIPCYNTSKYVGRTIEMLLAQDISDCELILVNDGSTDDTLSVLQNYNFASFITIVNQENKGVSVARNVGLSIAKGKYVYFFDSDDALTDGSLEYYKKVIRNNDDCTFFAFGYESTREGKVYKKYVYPHLDNRVVSGLFLVQSYLNKKFCVHICSCIFERNFLNYIQLQFPVGVTIGEDMLFLLQAMFEVEKAYYSKRMSYIYQIRNDSTMQGFTSYSFNQYRSHILLSKFLLPIASHNPKLSNSIHFFLLFSYLSNLRYYLRSNLKSKDLNNYFVKDGNIRFKRNCTSNIPYWLAMKVAMLLPIKLIIKIFKS